jgi:hypothetical protein
VSDRAIQDALIRALADAPYRQSAEWLERKLANPERVDLFARFLARHFYFERIVHFFKYSRALGRVTGRAPESVLSGEGFQGLLSGIVLGGRDSAVAVAKLVVAYVKTGDITPIPYLRDLLEYEEAMMVVESGARVWRETPTHDSRRTTRDVVERTEGTVLLDLDYDLPLVLPQLLRQWETVPQAPRVQTQLLIARSRHGRVSVARTSAPIEKIIELADGRRSLDDLARQAGLRPAELAATVQGLVEIGAVRFSTGS